MSTPPEPGATPFAVPGEPADRLGEARQRARQILGGEAHQGTIDDWRRALTSARDTVILLWLCAIAIWGFGGATQAEYLLFVLACGFALAVGLSTGRSAHAQVQYYAAELDRERREVCQNFEQEREELRALYAAKGLREPTLTQVVDTLAADDDRLLKVMVEEELGLTMQHMHHPLLVGAWNFLGSAVAGGLLTLPLMFMSPDAARIWIPAATVGLLVAVAVITARVSVRPLSELLADSLVMSVVAGGTVYFLAQWLAPLRTLGDG